MDRKTLQIVISRCLEASKYSVKFTWHGGEPTLVGQDFYVEAIELQKELKHPGQIIVNNIQTNGTLINKRWLPLLAEGNLKIGISLDGPEELHNLTRINAAGHGSYKETWEAIQLLRQAGIKFGVIAVINRFSIDKPDEIFHFFSENRISFSVNPCTASSDDPPEVKLLAIKPIEYAQFLLYLFDKWLGKNNPSFRIRPLDDLVKATMGKQPVLCKFLGTCQRYLTIGHDGNVYPCNGFLNPEVCFGNLFEEPFSNIMSTRKFRSYFERREIISSVCQKCKWYLVCKGGCMREWESETLLPTQQEYCEARQLLFSQIQSKLINKGYNPEVTR